ncbi:995_t:CDS:1 [Diversispora eburnea]|uniref:995_t:CDS:1 n=1 Tax=Diversispora eburnea TaxID=1213867 RepID=A0A9N8W5L1_9GLOM|nr:995_t:CDS:1 [Diversispora eburnea]
MATKIPTEILIKILNNCQSTRDLYSSLLVNRIWCKVTIPILWELPLGQECWGDDKTLRKKALCIRTYISCMDTHARTLLIQNEFDLSSSSHQATFDYPSFAHKFIIGNLVNFISIYLQQIVSSDQDNYKNTITKPRILFLEIFKLIINRCKFVNSFEMTGVHIKNHFHYIDLIGSILELPGAPKVFEKLETFVSATIHDERMRPLYESLTLICDNILNMNLSFDLPFQEQFFAKFISVQKRLENLSIDANYYQDCNSLLLAIVNHKETLKSLHLKSVNFFHFEGKSFGQIISLQELYIENCYRLQKSDSLFFASSFTQLSSFYFHTFQEYPQEFIIKIFETANTKLRKIYLNSYTTDIFLAILNYCTNIIRLTLHNKRSGHVIPRFNNNFSELRRFSFESGVGINANELLCQMALPESLEIIKIRMGIFNADSLRKFFEGWCCKGEGRNKKFIVKRTEQARLFKLSDEHFKVIEEYGVQFNMEELYSK